MSWINWIYIVSALFSAIAAALAWAAKLWWAKEYSAAKEEIVKAKDAQIERLKGEIQSIRDLTNETIRAKELQIEALNAEIHSLRELTPMKIREYFISVKAQLEEYNSTLQQQLDKAKADLQEKDLAIATYSQDTNMAKDIIQGLKTEKTKFEEQVASLESQLKNVRQEQNKSDEILSDKSFWLQMLKMLGAYDETQGLSISEWQRFVDTREVSIEALNNIKRETLYLWKGFKELRADRNEFTTEIREETLERVKDALETLRFAGHLDYKAIYDHDSGSGGRILRITITNITRQLRNFIKLILVTEVETLTRNE